MASETNGVIIQLLITVATSTDAKRIFNSLIAEKVRKPCLSFPDYEQEDTDEIMVTYWLHQWIKFLTMI